MIAPDLDCPECPECLAPCGSNADTPGPGWLRCGSCGQLWRGTDEQLAQAARADAAYEARRTLEDAGASQRVIDANRRLIAAARERAAAAHAGDQLDLLGGAS